MRVHPSKLEKIVNWPRPKTGKEISSFLGTVNWPKKHMARIAWVTAPLDAHRKAKALVWNEDLEKAFVLTKQLAFLSVNLLAMDSTKEMLIGTDASSVGLGFWQGQVKDKHRTIPTANLLPHMIEIVQFGSVALNNALKHSSATKKELSYPVHIALVVGFRG